MGDEPPSNDTQKTAADVAQPAEGSERGNRDAFDVSRMGPREIAAELARRSHVASTPATSTPATSTTATSTTESSAANPSSILRRPGRSDLSAAEVAAFFAPLPSFLHDRPLSNRRSPAYEAFRKQLMEEESLDEVDRHDPLEALSRALANRVAKRAADQSAGGDAEEHSITIPPMPTETIAAETVATETRATETRAVVETPESPAVPVAADTSSAMSFSLTAESWPADYLGRIAVLRGDVVVEKSETPQIASDGESASETSPYAAVAPQTLSLHILRGTASKSVAKSISIIKASHRFIKASHGTSLDHLSRFQSIITRKLNGQQLTPSQSAVMAAEAPAWENSRAQVPTSAFRWDILGAGAILGIIAAITPAVYVMRHQTAVPSSGATGASQLNAEQQINAGQQAPFASTATTSSNQTGNIPAALPLLSPSLPPAITVEHRMATQTIGPSTVPLFTMSPQEADRLLQSAQSLSTAAGPTTATPPTTPAVVSVPIPAATPVATAATSTPMTPPVAFPATPTKIDTAAVPVTSNSVDSSDTVRTGVKANRVTATSTLPTASASATSASNRLTQTPSALPPSASTASASATPASKNPTTAAVATKQPTKKKSTSTKKQKPKPATTDLQLSPAKR